MFVLRMNYTIFTAGPLRHRMKHILTNTQRQIHTGYLPQRQIYVHWQYHLGLKDTHTCSRPKTPCHMDICIDTRGVVEGRRMNTSLDSLEQTTHSHNLLCRLYKLMGKSAQIKMVYDTYSTGQFIMSIIVENYGIHDDRFFFLFFSFCLCIQILLYRNYIRKADHESWLLVLALYFI